MKRNTTNSQTITDDIRKRYKNTLKTYASFSASSKLVYLQHEEESYYKIKLICKYVLNTFQDVTAVYTDCNIFTRLSLGIVK